MNTFAKAFTQQPKLPRRPRLHRGLEFLAELRKLVGGEIADRPVVQSPLAPAPDIESLDGFDFGRAAFGAGGLGDIFTLTWRLQSLHLCACKG